MMKEFAVKAGSKVDLDKIDPDYTGGLTKEKAKELLQKNLERIEELQDALYAEHKQSVLVVLQGMDTAGKDGVIKALRGGVNLQGVSVHSFKAPAGEEKEHDFLWRVHSKVPGKGMMTIFNRSHYEDVLAARVLKIVPESVWKKRYAEINNFEETLRNNNTHVLKIFLYIDHKEQVGRLRKRWEDPNKRWKFSTADLVSSNDWKEHKEADEDALTKCSTADAPWYIIPSNKKWFRDYAFSTILLEYMENMKMGTPKSDLDPKEIEEGLRALEKSVGIAPPVPKIS